MFSVIYMAADQGTGDNHKSMSLEWIFLEALIITKVIIHFTVAVPVVWKILDSVESGEFSYI